MWKASYQDQNRRVVLEKLPGGGLGSLQGRQMLRILDFNNFFSFTGGGVRTYHMEKLKFYRNRPDVRYCLAVPSDRDDIERHGFAILRHIKAPTIPGAPNYRHVINPRKLRKIFEEEQPDLIEAGSPYLDPLLIRSAAKGMDAVITGFWHADFPTAYFETIGDRVHPLVGKTARRLGWSWARRTYGKYTATFASADCVVNELDRQGIHRVMQTPLGVDVDMFHPRKRDEKLRAAYGVDKDRPLIFFPHRLLEEKGINEVLEALPRIADATGSVFVFSGTGPRYPQLKPLVESREDVHYLGFVQDQEEMARWYASSDAIFALSAWETFGLSAVEAMSSGVPMIGADKGAVRDWITRSQCGTLVPHGNTERLVESTIGLLKNPERKTMGLRGRRFVAQYFSWPVTFERQLGFYQQLVDARRSGRELPAQPQRWNSEPVLRAPTGVRSGLA